MIWIDFRAVPHPFVLHILSTSVTLFFNSTGTYSVLKIHCTQEFLVARKARSLLNEKQVLQRPAQQCFEQYPWSLIPFLFGQR